MLSFYFLRNKMATFALLIQPIADKLKYALNKQYRLAGE